MKTEKENRTGFNPVFSYNTLVKVAGREVTVKRYEKKQIRGYVNARKVTAGHENNQVFQWAIENDAPCKYLCLERYEKITLKNAGILNEFEKVEVEENKRKRFIKSVNRAREGIFDIIGCNAGEWKTPSGTREKIKFMTLTFREDIEDIKQANECFGLFIKKMNYAMFNSKKADLKYLTIPELHGKKGYARAGKSVWHFHCVFFNLPPIPQGEAKALEWIAAGRWKDKDKNLTNIWGNGFVGINVIQNASRAASYVVKYLSKGINVDENGNVEYKSEGPDEGLKRLGDYDLYSGLGLENMKRYQCSRGMKKPIRRYLNMHTLHHREMMQDFRNKNALLPLDKTGKKTKMHEYKNKYRGKIAMVNFRLDKRYLNKFVQWLNVAESDAKNRRYLKVEKMKYEKFSYRKASEQNFVQSMERRNWIHKANEAYKEKAQIEWFVPVSKYVNVEEIERLFA